jgi:phosphohistidine swiveling domain-containing protein
MSAASSHPSAAGGTPDGSKASASELSEALVALEHALAKDPAIVGAKAAALARVRTAGLATAPGLVVTTRADVDRITADAAQFAAAVRKRLGDGPLIARSSSVAEDSAEQSMAGRFDTILDVVSADDLVAAVRGVVGSGARVAAEDGLDDVPAVAVLIQPMLDARFGGVCFAAEPVSGRIDRKFVVTSSSGPDAIVSGRVVGVRHLLDGTGRLLHRDGDEDWEAFLDRRRRRHLSWLVDRLGQLFGGPQDVEFLEEVQGRLVVLQSRPVTTALRGTPVGPVYGTGPVAETFPERLSPLEIDLWVPPLRDGLRETLRITSLASRSELRGRPLVMVHDGRVALDLELVGALPRVKTWRSRIDPRPLSRRARSTWRVGQLRAALPAIARELVGTTDDALAAVGSLGSLSDRQLVGLLQRGRAALRSLHGHEVMIGLLSGRATSTLTGLSVALRALVAARQQGLTDEEVLARSPVVLALTGPRIDGVELPSGTPAMPPPLPSEATGDEAAILREALRIRVRWVQELMARAARELGRRLVERGVFTSDLAVMDLRFDDLAALGTGAAVAREREIAEPFAGRRSSLRLPARFQFDPDGLVVTVIEPGRGQGVGAGGGVGSGPVTFDADDPAVGSVLVVDELRPALAPVIGRLAGLVAESGSPLAHVAILAREASVPTVVGLTGVMRSLEEGKHVEVDGDSGTVQARRSTTDSDEKEVRR